MPLNSSMLPTKGVGFLEYENNIEKHGNKKNKLKSKYRNLCDTYTRIIFWILVQSNVIEHT